MYYTKLLKNDIIIHINKKILLLGDIYMIDNIFEYIIVMAFESLLTYGDKKELTITQLHNYRMYLVNDLEKVLKNNTYLPKNSYIRNNVKSFLDYSLQIDSTKETEIIKRFVEKNSHTFSIKNNTISINPNVTAEMLNKEKMIDDKKTVITLGFLVSIQDSLELLSIIGATKTEKEIINIIKLEKLKEELFKQNTSEDERRLITICNRTIDSTMTNLLNKPPYYVYKWIRLFNQIYKKKYNNEISAMSKDDILTSNLDSDSFYIENQDVFNIDLNGINLNNFTLFSIFSTKDLYGYKIASQLEFIESYKVLEEQETLPDDEGEEEYDDYEKEFIDLPEEENYLDYEYIRLIETKAQDIDYFKNLFSVNTLFYLQYVLAINNYQKKYGFNQDLNGTKQRILYFLDQSNYDFTDETSVEKIIERLNASTDTDKGYFHDIYTLSQLFIRDIATSDNTDNNGLKKVLFISTYYDMVEDSRIKQTIDDFSSTKSGKKLKSAILDREYDIFEVKRPKGLVKSIIPKNNEG